MLWNVLGSPSPPVTSLWEDLKIVSQVTSLYWKLSSGFFPVSLKYYKPEFTLWAVGVILGELASHYLSALIAYSS